MPLLPWFPPLKASQIQSWPSPVRRKPWDCLLVVIQENVSLFPCSSLEFLTLESESFMNAFSPFLTPIVYWEFCQHSLWWGCPICVIDLDLFIQQIFVENLSCSVLAKCQLLKNLVISALFFLPYKSIPDSFVLSPFPRSQFQVICSKNKKLAGVAKDSYLGSFFSEREFGISAEIL